jgi:hypothetical protein
MSGPRWGKRKPYGLPAMICALLDALALQLNVGAAEGRHPLLRTPFAIMARALSTVIAFWTTSWVGRTLGLAWCIRTFRQGRIPPES